MTAWRSVVYLERRAQNAPESKAVYWTPNSGENYYAYLAYI